MSALPNRLTSSRLWLRLFENVTLQQEIVKLRDIVEVLASKISEQIPEFTDHSIKHLDALWWVADQVLTADEMSRVPIGEAFVLAGALYLHDLGMAVAATEAGANELKGSPEYKNARARLLASGIEPSRATLLALRYAARALHAGLAERLAADPVPGLNRCLIEASEIRANWGAMIGQVAASHHWSIPEVERRLGIRGKTPDATGGVVDLGYLASVLRVIDYAHINMDRASYVEQLLRPSLPKDSAIHWAAQEHITGPVRDGNQLVYGSTRGIKNVEGWWTFFEMATGLDSEITSVNEYLSSRTASTSRFSLEGVKGIKSPQTFSALVATEGFEPVDIRFRPDSMDRLIHILGGRTLYGADFYAPIRELLQNAADAISISKIDSDTAGANHEAAWIRVALAQDKGHWYLSVSDSGVGMSAHVVTKYLLGIAADYWNSADYFADHANAAHAGFRPVGRFGIGFLSVFMLGAEVEVQTQRRGGQAICLRLHGIGQRGSLERRTAGYNNGTTVRVRIAIEMADDLSNDLSKIVLAKAPMLSVPIDISTPLSTFQIVPGWWMKASQVEFIEFLNTQESTSFTPARLRKDRHAIEWAAHLRQQSLAKLSPSSKWPMSQPEVISSNSRVIAVPDLNRLLLCSKGFAVATVHAPGLAGMIDIGDQELNAARSQTLEWNIDDHRAKWLALLRPQIVNALNDLEVEGDIPARYGFLVKVAEQHGIDVLLDSTLPWITIREKPGNAMLIHAAEFIRRANVASEILLIYGAGPWNSEKFARRQFQASDPTALIIPISTEGQPDVGSYDDDDNETIDGSLEEHFVGGRIDRARDPNDALLLHATILAIARTWGQEPSALNVTWRRQKRVMCGRFMRAPPKLASKST